MDPIHVLKMDLIDAKEKFGEARTRFRMDSLGLSVTADLIGAEPLKQEWRIGYAVYEEQTRSSLTGLQNAYLALERAEAALAAAVASNMSGCHSGCCRWFRDCWRFGVGWLLRLLHRSRAAT